MYNNNNNNNNNKYFWPMVYIFCLISKNMKEKKKIKKCKERERKN